MEEELQQLRTNASGDLMSDEDFIKTIESMSVETQEREINDLLKAMHENRIVSWDEAERILQETDRTPIKCSLPEQTRPTEPDNECDVDVCIRKLLDNDPSLKEVNLNNMKRTPIPAIKRLLEALAYNEHCERVSLANMGLYDHDIMILVTVIEMNQAIKKLNLETNYLSGEFFAKLFKAALTNQTVEEIKAVNQGVSFSTQSEKEIIEAIVKNTGLTKISINFRLPEGRHKVENATLRNGEFKRIKRREAAKKAKEEAEELAKNPVPKLVPEIKKEVAKPTISPTPSKTQKSLPIVGSEPKRTPLQTPIAKIPSKCGVLPKQLSYQRASRESEEETEEISKQLSGGAPKKLKIPNKFVSEDVDQNEKPELEKVARRATKQWAPKKIESDIVEKEAENLKDEVTIPIKDGKKKQWEGSKIKKPVDEGYAPTIDLSGGKSEELPTIRAPLRTSVTAKNIWEQRLAKIEKKEERKNQRPLMSIQKIREMERKSIGERKSNEILKETKKPVEDEEKKKEAEPKQLNGDFKPTLDAAKSIKIVAKKPNRLIDPPLTKAAATKSEKTDDESRPTTIIRRTVIRKKIEPIDNGTNHESDEKTVKKKVIRKKKKPINNTQQSSTNS